MQKADLHIHTTASDSLLPPSEVVRWAGIKRLKAIGITDHDTVDGIDEAIACAAENGVEIVPGVELNTEYQEEEIHILGYYMNYKKDWFVEKLDEIRNSRYKRASGMVEKLNGLGLKLSMEQVEKEAGGGLIGRPHIARVMIREGYIDNIKEAFVKYIGKGCIAYVERYKLGCGEAIEIIKELGGVPVLAHPGLIRNRKLIPEILDMGMLGIEVYHTKHDEETTRNLLAVAGARKLLVTGGTDCHGNFVNNEPILGNVTVDYINVERLKEKASYYNLEG